MNWKKQPRNRLSTEKTIQFFDIKRKPWREFKSTRTLQKFIVQKGKGKNHPAVYTTKHPRNIDIEVTTTVE